MKFFGKKCFATFATLFAVSLLVFLSFSLMAGDPATVALGTEATPQKLEALREEMGLNAPLYEQYIKWVVQFVKGDMGTSYSYKLPVSSMILDKLPVTLTLAALSFVMIMVLAIPLGLYSAKRQGGAADRILLVVNQFIMAVPPFFSGILITYLFGRILKVFTPGGYVSYQERPGSFLYYMLFPAMAVALPKAAMAAKLLRSSVLEELRKDYVRTAFSRGNRSNQVFYGHILKNAILPVITFLGMALADIVAGSIIIEQVFSIPGLGRILLSSISNRDYPVVQAIIVWIAFFIVMINLLVDVVYRAADPRIGKE